MRSVDEGSRQRLWCAAWLRTAWKFVAGCCLAIAVSPATDAQVVLFDAALGTAASAQGWPLIADPIVGNTVIETVGTGFTALDTTQPITDRGGYFSQDPVLGIFRHPNMPTIDRQLGYSIRFDLRIAEENHVMGPAGDDNGDLLEDRAGFAVIALSNDQLGIELSFWEDRIWAQEDDATDPTLLFTQAEGNGFDTTANMTGYDLRIWRDAYQLVYDGGVAPILAGRLRDYRNFMGSIDPYEIPNFLFFGDNTTRGESSSELAYIAVDPLPSPCQDADALVAEIVAGTDRAPFDLTGDGRVDLADLTAWRSTAGDFYLGAGRAFLPGDANLDGSVDGTDFNIWNVNKFTNAAAWCAGDFNADGLIDGGDFNLWNVHKFSSSAVAVPEPAAVFWLAAAAMGWIARRRGPRRCDSFDD